MYSYETPNFLSEARHQRELQSHKTMPLSLPFLKILENVVIFVKNIYVNIYKTLK